MSKMTIHNLECPHCGNKQETKVWHSVNVKLDPELKRKLFDAQINMFSCEKCGKKTFINAPLLYHDMTQQFFVQYYPPESLDEREFFLQFDPELKRKLFDAQINMFSCEKCGKKTFINA